MTDYKNELEKALEKLKFTVLNRKVTEKDWESEIFFEVTSEFKATIEALLSKRGLEARIKQVKSMVKYPDVIAEKYKDDLVDGYNSGLLSGYIDLDSLGIEKIIQGLEYQLTNREER